MRQNTTWSNTNTFPFYKLFQHLFLELNNIPAAHWSENKESIEKLESWRKNTLNVNTRPNLVNMYTLHKSPVLEPIQEGIQWIQYNLDHFAYSFSENQECFKQGRLLSAQNKACCIRLDFQDNLYIWKSHHHQVQLRTSSTNGKDPNPVATWKINLP